MSVRHYSNSVVCIYNCALCERRTNRDFEELQRSYQPPIPYRALRGQSEDCPHFVFGVFAGRWGLSVLAQELSDAGGAWVGEVG